MTIRSSRSTATYIYVILNIDNENDKIGVNCLQVLCVYVPDGHPTFIPSCILFVWASMKNFVFLVPICCDIDPCSKSLLSVYKLYSLVTFVKFVGAVTFYRMRDGRGFVFHYGACGKGLFTLPTVIVKDADW